eukprot:5687098-Prymnesium_polylepis.1
MTTLADAARCGGSGGFQRAGGSCGAMWAGGGPAGGGGSESLRARDRIEIERLESSRIDDDDASEASRATATV